MSNIKLECEKLRMCQRLTRKNAFRSLLNINVIVKIPFKARIRVLITQRISIKTLFWGSQSLLGRSRVRNQVRTQTASASIFLGQKSILKSKILTTSLWILSPCWPAG
jgi:hypothetical protein